MLGITTNVVKGNPIQHVINTNRFNLMGCQMKIHFRWVGHRWSRRPNAAKDLVDVKKRINVGGNKNVSVFKKGRSLSP